MTQNTIKINRAIRKAVIGDCPASSHAMLDAIPPNIIAGLPSTQLATLIDAMWRVCELSKAIADRDAVDAGAVWCAKRQQFLEVI